jgi:hypothetical protein
LNKNAKLALHLICIFCEELSGNPFDWLNTNISGILIGAVNIILANQIGVFERIKSGLKKQDGRQRRGCFM